jgi:hypothetical protein
MFFVVVPGLDKKMKNVLLSLSAFLRLVVSVDGFCIIASRRGKSFYLTSALLTTTTIHLGQQQQQQPPHPWILAGHDENYSYDDDFTLSSADGYGGTTTAPKIVASSRVLGNISPIRVPGQDDNTFMKHVGVPTFRADGCNTTTIILPLGNDPSMKTSTTIREIEALTVSLGHGPALVMDHVLSELACRDIVETCERIGFGKFHAGKNHHGAMQIVVANSTVHEIAQCLAPHI